jgi:phosphoglucomutase
MSKTVNPKAGLLADPAALIDIPSLITAYYEGRPDANLRAQRVAFGTSGHRGSSFTLSFNERHILAIAQAIYLYRKNKGIDGPLFMGFDTHALSRPAFATALEVLAAHDVPVMISEGDEYTPTPAISHAIIAYNRGRISGLADGIVITPSHNPPEFGGFKYNPPHGGPAETKITNWIETKANEILADTAQVKRLSYDQALRATTTTRHDYVGAYVADLANVIDMEAIRASGLHLAADALGGAGIHYWHRIAERYGLDLTVLNAVADPTFRFMHYDWDGKIRMDPSSPDAMRGLTGLKDNYDLAFACDTDHDRHGIVTKGDGLMPPNYYLAASADYLFSHRPAWNQAAGLGKTVVSSAIIDRVAWRQGRTLFEPPVGFKWFVEGLSQGMLGFVGEESAGAVFLRCDGQVWTTDKDGIIAGLLSAEMTARTGKDPAALYRDLTSEVGESWYRRSDADATQEQRDALSRVTSETIAISELAGEPVQQVLTKAPGNGKAIGGIKVIALGGWFAARPSGTEDITKIYAESFEGEAHLGRIETEARAFVARLMSEGASI